MSKKSQTRNIIMRTRATLLPRGPYCWAKEERKGNRQCWIFLSAPSLHLKKSHCGGECTGVHKGWGWRIKKSLIGGGEEKKRRGLRRAFLPSLAISRAVPSIGTAAAVSPWKSNEDNQIHVDFNEIWGSLPSWRPKYFELCTAIGWGCELRNYRETPAKLRYDHKCFPGDFLWAKYMQVPKQIFEGFSKNIL